MKKLILLILPIAVIVISSCSKTESSKPETKILGDSLQMVAGSLKNRRAVLSQIFPKDFDPKYLISQGQVGIFKIRYPLPPPYLLAKYTIRKEQKFSLEEGCVDCEFTAYVVSENGHDLLSFQYNYDEKRKQYTQNLVDIEVVSDKYKTIDGVGVNTTISEFQSIYPDYNFWVDGRCVIETSKFHGVQFDLNPEDFIGKVGSYGDSAKISDFKEKSKIASVRLFSSD